MQPGRGVIDGEDRVLPALSRHPVDCLHPADRGQFGEESPGGGGPEGHDDLGAHNAEFLVEGRRPLRDFLLGWWAVLALGVDRAQLHEVGDVELPAAEGGPVKGFVQDLPSPADEGPPCDILVHTWGLAHKHDEAGGGTFAGDDHRAVGAL